MQEEIEKVEKERDDYKNELETFRNDLVNMQMQPQPAADQEGNAPDPNVSVTSVDNILKEQLEKMK